MYRKWIILSIVGLLCLIIIFVFILPAIGIYSFSIFGPKFENVKRNIFEQTKSYNEGKEQDLLRLRLEYLKSKDNSEKEAIASTIRLMFADYDETLLSEDLRMFLEDIKYGGLK